MHIARKKEGKSRQKLPSMYDEGKEVLLDLSEKDIGVIVDDHINFAKHIQQQINKANSIIGLIRRTYTFLYEQSFSPVQVRVLKE